MKTRGAGAQGPSGRAKALFVVATVATGVLGASAVETLFAAPANPIGLIARDEPLEIRLSGAARLAKINDGGIVVRPVAGLGSPEAHGTFVAGRALIDRTQSRSVIVRPEAVREYYELVKGMTRADATVAANHLLDRVERTGKLAALNTIDAALREKLGPTAGTRLDDSSVFAAYPAQLLDSTIDNDDPLTLDVGDNPLEPYRTRIAGDDDLWRSYLINGDVSAFASLATNPEFERTYHEVDTATGQQAESSVLRNRENRRVLMLRDRNAVTYVPDLPVTSDLSDTGFGSGGAYEMAASRAFRAIARRLLPARGGSLPFARGLAKFSTEPDPVTGAEFTGGKMRGSTAATGRPRVVNVTPPNGEILIDFTTDWEDPDNQFTVPIPLRRAFVWRLRFSRPMDPRTVGDSLITLTKTAVVTIGGQQIPKNELVPATVSLHQTRLGEVLVQIRPVTLLDPQGVYEVRVAATVRALDGTELGTDFVAGIQTR